MEIRRPTRSANRSIRNGRCLSPVCMNTRKRRLNNTRPPKKRPTAPLQNAPALRSFGILQTTPTRYPQLDGLRGLAALVVLAHHYWPGSALWDPTGGRIGVDFFFVLSGFLITRSLVRDRAEAPGNPWPRLLRFYVRRVRRIIPLFYTTLALGALLRWDRIRVSLPWHLSFLSNVYFIR